MDTDAALIFISHASEDAEATRLLQLDLDDRFMGAVRFFNTSSRDSLRIGEQWLKTIMDSLTASRIILPILSPIALRSPWVNFETGGAWLNKAVVIPCCGGQTRKDSLPPPYSWLQAINLDDPDDLELLVNRIADEVKLRPRTEGLNELAERMSAVFALGRVEAAEGAGAALGNRVEEHLEFEWCYRTADHDRTRWAARYHATRRFRVTDPFMEYIAISFAPAVETISFSTERPPKITLNSWTRSSAGTVRVAAPHARRGSKFAFRVYFEPPLRANDTASIDMDVDFPEYRVGTREDFVMAQLDGDRIAITEFVQNTREVSRPTELLIYRVIIPKYLKASPIDPAVSRYNHTFADEENFVRSNSEVYSVREEDVDGEACWVLELRRANPPYLANYKLRWRLPSRQELTTAS